MQDDWSDLKQTGDTTPCRMTGVTLHSHVHFREIDRYLRARPPRSLGRRRRKQPAGGKRVDLSHRDDDTYIHKYIIYIYLYI